MQQDGLKGWAIIILSIALASYSIYLGHYEIILVYLYFYIFVLLLNRFTKKS
jgi:hypothetical protein